MESAVTDPRLLRLAESDNVLIVIGAIGGGETIAIGGTPVTTDCDLAVGFKVAAADLAVGDLAIRYGMPIGRVTAPVQSGALVHTHNLASRYIPTHNRGEA